MGTEAVFLQETNIETVNSLHLHECTVSFRDDTKWMPVYQRNNKSRGQKNLRCFPSCCAGFGHQEGFCGQSICIIARLPRQIIEKDQAIAIAEFALSTANTKKYGQVFRLQEANKYSRTSVEGNVEYMEGCKLPIPEAAREFPYINVQFEFNKNLKGWHYGFCGSKRTRNFQHIFRAYVLVRTSEENIYSVIGSISSPPWKMFCRRRKQNPDPGGLHKAIENSQTNGVKQNQTLSQISDLNAASKRYRNRAAVPEYLLPNPHGSLKGPSVGRFGSLSDNPCQKSCRVLEPIKELEVPFVTFGQENHAQDCEAQACSFLRPWSDAQADLSGSFQFSRSKSPDFINEAPMMDDSLKIPFGFDCERNSSSSLSIDEVWDEQECNDMPNSKSIYSYTR